MRTVDVMSRSPCVPCVGAVVRDSAGRLLLVRRVHPPAPGSWSLPGGRVEAGETDEAACRREVAEETGLDVVVGALVGTVELAGPSGVTYEIRDYTCRLLGGELRCGDDASDVGWFAPSDLAALDVVPGLLTHLLRWQVLGPLSTPP